MNTTSGRRPFISEQIAEILNRATLQPLPSVVFEQLDYDIEKQDGEKIYQLVKEDILSRSFNRYQELGDIDYHLILDALQSKVKGFEYAMGDTLNLGTQKAYRIDIRRLNKLIEKVELIRENNQQ